MLFVSSQNYSLEIAINILEMENKGATLEILPSNLNLNALLARPLKKLEPQKGITKREEGSKFEMMRKSLG